MVFYDWKRVIVSQMQPGSLQHCRRRLPWRMDVGSRQMGQLRQILANELAFRVEFLALGDWVKYAKVGLGVAAAG